MVIFILYINLVLLNILDFMYTSRILELGGGEANPIQDFMIQQFGPIGMLYLKAFSLSAAAIALYIAPPKAWITNTFIGLNILYMAVIVYSYYIILQLL